jgi:outer membrane receptor protein involved in Fe transport
MQIASTSIRLAGATSPSSRFVRLAFLFVFVASCLFAQSAGFGSISGVVTDASGAAVPSAKVLVDDEAKGIHRTLETNAGGVFSAPALTPDAGYSVTVTKEGFSKYRSENLQLQVGQNIDLHIQLNVASSSTQVDVTAEAPVVEDTKTDISQVVGEKQILDLPINGRRVDSFVLLTPGVVPDGAFGLLSFRGVAGHNSFLTDGNDTTNQYYNENSGRTRIQSQISQEAVQEFQVISNNFAAEYGNAMGGVVNTITKSGSNQIHGTGYFFFRNRTLDARDRYATFNPQDIRKQSGVSLGGAIKKDKLFYYFNYEATRRNFPAIASVTTSNLFTAAGTLDTAKNPCPNPTAAVKATDAQCQAALTMITTRNFGTVSRRVTQDLGFGKIDYRLSDRNTLSFSLNFLRWISPHGIQATGIVFNTGAAIGSNADSTVRNAYGRAQWTSIVSSSAVNEARFGWFKDRQYDPASPDFLYPGLGLADLTVNSTFNLGIAPNYPRLNPSETRFQFADNLSWTRGAHTMKFGVDFAHTEDYQNQLMVRYGSYSYQTLNAFALDFSGNTTGAKNWSTYSQRFGNPIFDASLKTIGLYAQDQWRVSPRLTVNYGLRYDYTKIPQPKIVNPDYPQTGTIHSAPLNFAPRAGIAYSLTKDHKTLLRAGYGIFFARYQTGLINTFFLNNNVYQQFITYGSTTPAQLAAGPVYPNFLPGTSLSPPAGSTDIIFADKNLRNPYTHQANIGIERELSSTLSLNVSYAWSRGVRLYGVRDLNVGSLGAPVTYTIVDASGSTVGTYTTPTYRTPRPDTRYRRIGLIDNPGLSYYDGLLVQLNKRFSQGFQGGVAYTWSHAIDLNQSNGSNNIFFGSTPTSFANGDFTSEKGSAANDVRHRLVVNSIWTPTFMKGNSAFARYVVNNWQLSQVTTLQSAQPTNSTINVSGFAFPGALSAGSLNGLGGGFSRVPFQPVSNLDIDRIYKVDARLAKRLPFGERVTLYLQFEAFNVFNTPYDTSRRTAEFNTSNFIISPISSYGSGSSSAASPDGTSARRAQVSVRVTF